MRRTSANGGASRNRAWLYRRHGGRAGYDQAHIFQVNGEPTGYIQVWRIGPHQTEAWSKDNPWLLDLPSHAVGVDLSIGEADKLSKGIGSAVLRAFVGKLKAEGHSAIIIDPDPENTRAVRAYAKAGFKPVPKLAGRAKAS